MEYINGVNAIGNMSVDSDKVSHDVHTSRCVVVDDALYESDANYKAKVDKCIEEGLYRVSSDGSGGSGGGGDIFFVDVTETRDPQTEAQTFELDTPYSDIEEAFDSGKKLILRVVSNSHVFRYFQLTDVTYASSPYSFTFMRLYTTSTFDPSTGPTFLMRAESIHLTGSSVTHYDVSQI